jgi:hypothetical protein
MPPSAIRLSVNVAMYSECRSGASLEAVERHWRSRSSMFVACGNFGAPPKPPNSESNWAARFSRAMATGAAVSGVCPVAAGAIISANACSRASPCLAMSSLWVR